MKRDDASDITRPPARDQTTWVSAQANIIVDLAVCFVCAKSERTDRIQAVECGQRVGVQAVIVRTHHHGRAHIVGLQIIGDKGPEKNTSEKG